MSTVRRMIIVGGGRVDEERFLSALASKDQGATQRLVKQLEEDSKSGGSLGIGLVSKAFGARVEAFLVSRLSGDREAGAEAWNDTLLRVYLKISEFDPTRASFRTWVYNQANYAAKDRRRALAREARAVVQPELALYGLEDPLSRAEVEALQRAYQSLNPTQRRLLWERYVVGREPAKIARLEEFREVPPAHIRVYINRAAARLKQLYEKERS